ncbi:fasciclin domain-containing protein [Maritalea mediterranea]|uniref:Fasciclin domain-containing protein n=1 Tax=Maritalea mediterranea TaxID=2909667 RepID=A0ABS9E247_9HYPH|nr:fasciclin domain-containing protein [Maritalea mediterranea]MCF4096934.1 fasciclin domain-containing protein [Maritalea mediterranea]
MLKSILKTSSALFVAASLGFAAAPALADGHGAKMNIVETAIASEAHTTLVAAVQAAGLVETLQGDGPFTVFAPTNDAFAALPEGTVESLLEPENKEMLIKVLTAHVVAGDVRAADLLKAIEDNGGAYEFETVSGDMLKAEVRDGNVFIIDENGNAGQVTAADLAQTNGVIHVVNAVLVPK